MISYNLTLFCVGDLGPNLEQGEREGKTEKDSRDSKPTTWRRGDLNTWLPRPDWSDRSKGQVRLVGSAAALYMSSINGGVSFFDPKSSLRCLHVDEDSVPVRYSEISVGYGL